MADAMTGWTETGLRQAMAEEEHHRTHGRVITLNDVANRLVALADSASTYADVYAIILEDETLHSEVQAAIELGNTDRLAPAGTTRASAEDAIDLATCVLIIKARQAEKAKPATSQALVEEAVAKATGLK